MTIDGVPTDQHGPPPAEAVAAETQLKGHLGHLTTQEETAFEEFRKLTAKAGFYTAATDDEKASHDDGTLMYVDPRRTLHTANLLLDGTCELGGSALKRHSFSSKTPRFGARIMTWMLFTRG